MVEPILTSPFFLEYILPFVLVFTLIFAILQKTQLLGDGKKQIDAIISLVVGLILISFPFSRDFVVLLMPFLAISAVVLLVFMLLFGFITGKTKGDVLNKGLKIALSIIMGLALLTVILMIGGWWDLIYSSLFERSDSAQIWINVLLVVIIAGAVASVVLVKDSGSSSSSSTS